MSTSLKLFSPFCFVLFCFGRKVAVVNLDPANDALPYPFSMPQKLVKNGASVVS